MLYVAGTPLLLFSIPFWAALALEAEGKWGTAKGGVTPNRFLARQRWLLSGLAAVGLTIMCCVGLYHMATRPAAFYSPPHHL